VDGVNECDVRKDLREISGQVIPFNIILLRKNSNVIGRRTKRLNRALASGSFTVDKSSFCLFWIMTHDKAVKRRLSIADIVPLMRGSSGGRKPVVGIDNKLPSSRSELYDWAKLRSSTS
jgi:hypothetical protein